jgi:hypothetical protein
LGKAKKVNAVEPTYQDLVILQSSEDAGVSLINLSQIRLITELETGAPRLWFSETHVVTVTGRGAAELMIYLLEKSKFPGGQPYDATPIRAMYESLVSAQPEGATSAEMP